MSYERLLATRLPLLCTLLACLALPGCAVVTVAGAVVGVGATVVGVAADVAVGTVKLTGKAVGAAVDAVTPTPTDE